MKRILLILAIALGYCMNASAQYSDVKMLTMSENEVGVAVPDGLKYRQLKDIYDYKLYAPSVWDKHKPALAGVASYFIPGLGQMVCGEVGRGFLWLGGTVASCVVTTTGFMYWIIGAFAGSKAVSVGGFATCMLGLGSYTTIYVCQIVDAVRVAKIKNMYEQDRMSAYTLDLELFPSINFTQTPSGVKPAAGLTLALNF